MTLDFSEEKRFCILCRGELTDIPDNINSHPSCQQILDDFIPEQIGTDFQEFFRRLNGFLISPMQEQMYLLLENKESRYYISGRQIGRTTFLMTYIIWKAIETNERWGMVVHSRQADNYVARRLKEKFMMLAEEEMDKIGVEIIYPFHPQIIKNDCKVESYFKMEIPDLRRFDDKILFGSFRFNKLIPMHERRSYNLITDPIY